MSEERHVLESRAAALGDKALEWNELDFVGWKEFRRMAPAVIALEVSRLERRLAALEPGCADYNALVRARYELRQFVDGLDAAARDSIPQRSEHLGRALLAVSLLADGDEALRYTTHRLTYVHNRLNLIY